MGEGSEDRRRLAASEKSQSSGVAMPRYWVAEAGFIATERKGQKVKVPGVHQRLEEIEWERDWLCGWRDVCRTTDERTAIPAFIPRVAVGHTYPLMLPRVSATLAAVLIAAQSSLVFDFVGRQKVSGAHMSLMTWKQLPVPAPGAMELHAAFVTRRVMELVYTAHDMASLARDLGDRGHPFRWDELRRALIRAELDAYFFHLYGIERNDVDYILEAFQTENGGLKHNDIAKYGSYRTKELVLAEYDRMAAAGLSLTSPLIDGQNYVSALNPWPGCGPRHEVEPVATGDSAATRSTQAEQMTAK